MRNVLSISHPIIDSYPIFGHITTIVPKESEAGLTWFYNYFVQINTYTYYVPKTPEDKMTEFRIYYEAPSPYSMMGNFKNEYISRAKFNQHWKDIVSFVKYFIDQRKYVYILTDVSKIKIYHLNAFYIHDPLLYGYDDEKKEIYFTDNYKYGKYSSGIMSYEELRSATESFAKNGTDVDWMGGYQCIQYQEEKTENLFDKELYANLLSCYMEAKSTGEFVDPHTYMMPWEHKIWGMDIYPAMDKYLTAMVNAGGQLDRRAFYVLQEHRILMEKALVYALGETWQSWYPLEAKWLQDEIRIASIMLTLSLKNNITKDVTIIEKIKPYLVELEELDKRLFPSLIHLIRKSI